ncbi:hypothetical protein [Oceanispirochaeta sp.]|jgi:hypothetical protein|uniref:hypothetical protein n=1 Tax=Oceanispirochaeta sp. TaxID=2035350 RepID=UPI00260BEF2A|nr:hypothetical protein [Oceanispirochaeta sp.]MDA3958930.1 hypothetical protein [Oceanispirochaeta sp.]
MIKARIFVQIVSLLILFSCESSLYPPTYPPVLSDISLTSSSSKTATNSVIQGDTVFLTVAVDDPENDSLTLTISILSGGTEIKSLEVNDSCIYDGTSWETWFETDDLALGDYTLALTPTDKEGNKGDTLTEIFTVTENLKANVTTADISISAVSYEVKNTTTGEPFIITFSVTNSSPVTLDIVHVPFDAEDSSDTVLDSGVGIITSIPSGATKEGYLKLNIQVTENCDELIYSFANCTITIY